MGRDKGKGKEVKRGKGAEAKRPRVSASAIRDSRRPTSATEQTMQQAFGSPFILQSPREGNLYKALSQNSVNPHAHIDMDGFDVLKIEDDLKRYLRVLGCEQFAQTVWLGYAELALEFVCTFARRGESTTIDCRLLGEDIAVTPSMMSRVFGFHNPNGAISQLPLGFNPNDAWYELTGFHNWHSSGMSPGLLQDPALIVLHKFLSFSIFGKKESAKVNTVEAYLMWAAKKGIKICLTGFIWKQIELLHVQLKGYAAWAHIATGIAMSKNFDIPPMTEVDSILINVASLKRAHYLTDSRTWRPYDQRPIVLQSRRAMDGGASFSRSAPQTSHTFADEQMEEEAAYEQPFQEPFEQPFQQPYQMPPFVPQPPVSQAPPSLWQYQPDPNSGAPQYFDAFQQSFFSQFQAFNTRFDGLCTDVSSMGKSIASLTTSMGAMSTRLDSVDRRMKGLEDSWNYWNKGEDNKEEPNEEGDDEEYEDEDEEQEEDDDPDTDDE